MATIPYEGPPELREPALQALARVIDPEMALGILDLGLVYGLVLGGGTAHVRLTMTSAACPVAELIEDDVVAELRRALGEGTRVEVELCWEPPWSPERMTDGARAAMGL